MTRILFVCLGNIIRSPLAEHAFRQAAEQAGAEDRYQADSAGTAGWHTGEQPDPRMRKTAAAHGLEYDGRARQVSKQDFEDFDLIVAMDSSNYRSLSDLAGSEAAKSKIRLMREFDPQADGMDVPDPYYGGQDGFEETFQIVRRSVDGLLEALQSGELSTGS